MRAGVGLSLIIAFVSGSIPFAWLIAKLWGINDLRKVGSSNVGATNVVRTAGWIPGALTFLLDFAKGFLPVLLVPVPSIWVGLAAIAGHCFSPFLKFRGGKGVSTTLGVLVGLFPWLGGASILAYVLTLAAVRVSAIGSLFAMLTALFGAVIFLPDPADKIGIGLIVVLVLARHRDNWIKLLNGAAVVALTAGLAAAAATTLMPSSAQAAGMTTATAPTADFRGHPIVFKTPPRHVVVLMPALAEMIIDLGAGNRLVGAPDYTRLPADLKHVTNLGPYNRISAEAVYALHPDAVFASMDGDDATMVAQLEELGLKVVTVNTQSLDDIARTASVLSTTLGVSLARADKLRTALAAVGPSPSQRHNAHHGTHRVFVQVGWDPIVTVAQHTFIDELVSRAGGQNIFHDAAMKYPRPNPEEVIARNPDTIVICQLTDDGSQAKKARTFWMRFKDLAAVKAHRVFISPVDHLTKPGFNLISGYNELKSILR